MKRYLLFIPLFSLASALDADTLGRSVYAESCASCHGDNGRGDGPAAPNLGTPPADLTRIAARRDGIWPMLEVMSIIDGYARSTLPRENMPVFDGFLEGEMIDVDTGNGLNTPMPKKLVALVDYLETLQDPAPTGYVP